MWTKVKAILALGTVGLLAVGSTASVRAQFPPQPPPVYYGSPAPLPPPPYGYYPPPPPHYMYYPPSSRWHTRNGCPPHYIVHHGLCKPYRGY
jgi:hypothetical protein